MASTQPGSELPICPFCGFQSSDSYTLMHHVEISHPENGFSPFVAPENVTLNTSAVQQRSASPSTPEDFVAENDLSDAGDNYIECPTGCGEQIRFSELSVHLDLHFAESAVLEETGCEELAKEHVDKKWSDYMADAQDQLSKKVAQVLDAQDFVLAPRDPRKANHKASTRVSTASRHKNKEVKTSKDAAHATSSRRPRPTSV